MYAIVSDRFKYSYYLWIGRSYTDRNWKRLYLGFISDQKQYWRSDFAFLLRKFKVFMQNTVANFLVSTINLNKIHVGIIWDYTNVYLLIHEMLHSKKINHLVWN